MTENQTQVQPTNNQISGVVKLGVGLGVIGTVFYFLQEKFPELLTVVLFACGVMIALGLVKQGTIDSLQGAVAQARTKATEVLNRQNQPQPATVQINGNTDPNYQEYLAWRNFQQSQTS